MTVPPTKSAFTPARAACLVCLFGVLSWICGLVAEHHKASAGTPNPGKNGVTICQYPKGLTLPMGYVSVVFLAVTTALGYYSLFYPYYGKSIPCHEAFGGVWFSTYFNLSLFTTGLAAILLLWPTITEHLHYTRNVHHGPTDCPTAKTALLGGGAFAAFGSCLFWMLTLMFMCNAREEYFEEAKEGDCSQPVEVYGN